MALKRQHPGDDAPGSESSDDDFGPALPSSVPPKKKRKLPFEALYVEALPKGVRYSKSLMHKEQISSVTVAPSPVDFVITASVDGVVKFWKKVSSGIDFAKEYAAHEGRIRGSAVSADGSLYATVGDEDDLTVKIFDVVTFDLLAIINLETAGTVVCWVYQRGSPPYLAVSVGNEIHIFDGRGIKTAPLHKLANLHRTEVVAMAYNQAFDCVVSADASGMVEYWQPRENFEKPDNVFKIKSSTNLFDFKKAKSAPCCISISPSGHQFATFSFPDRKVRVFDFTSGKLRRSYDESIETLTAMHEAGTSLHKIDQNEFNRRLATERELDSAAVRSRINICFDESGHFICYGSLHGIKVVNTTTSRVMRVYGKDESFRALDVAMYQGAPQQKGVVTVSMATSNNPLLEAAEERDPMLFATGYGKVRFYMFTNEESPSKSNRDVHNEKPKQLGKKQKEEQKEQRMGSAAMIHTNMGDIHIRLFPQHTPKTVENFTTHARNGYYNNTIFHRVIRKFMIQGGDPLGDGTGGTSIWGGEFEDEFHPDLKHDRPYTVSMANAGPNSNGSQFFITTAEKADWLDKKHTVFGRVEKGKDVVHLIENVRTVKEKPEDDIKIINISVH
ncbi:Peptidyl-prolyl cis-trans isomerase cyp15 [Lithohypha guttulata]|uniref:Peptidyl-prolyl cis-trans isomerase-like 1 n=1 Tax=Lithohypha guttulata TaxID=1690604 RepID=A0AAN7T6B5_9EURO|nr:Peptidyl-prolyl cis-trans isomerase cyp15 [Lithohypha guttulata]KAK5090502.1 Peptidyl-prolyl cis-trans isomerase cyp15 [Lithohypha guttulata]